MRNKLKNYLKHGIYLFGIILVFNNCTKDELTQETMFSSNSIKNIHITTFDKVKEKPRVSKSINRIFEQKLLKSNSNNFDIDTTNVQTLVTENYINYTFEVNMNIDNNNLNNYILTVYNDGSYHQMLASYPILNETDIEYDMSNIYIEPITGEMLVQKTFGDCLGTITWEWTETTVTYNCTEGASCTGNYCDGQWTDPYQVTEGAWVPVCKQNFFLSPSPDDGSRGGGGGIINPPNVNEPIAIVPFSLKRECKKVKKLIDSLENFDQQLNTLATTAPTIDHEISISYTTGTPTTMNILEGTQGSGGTAIDPNPSEPYATIAHIHDNYGLDGSGTYSVPSFADLKLLAEILYNNKLNPRKFVAFLSTAKGTHFAITINNASKFLDLFYSKLVLLGNINRDDQSVFTKWEKSNKSLNKLSWKYYDEKNPIRLITATNPSSENESTLRNFLSFLNEGDAGVSVFETDENFEEFSEVKLEPFTLISNVPTVLRKPCN
jgi:hypothetical protein